MVETVSHAELVPLAESMIDLGEQVTVVNRIGIDAGGNLRAWVTDGAKPRVDNSHICRWDGREAGLV